MNPTAVLTEMGRCVMSDPAVSATLMARTPQGKCAGKYCFNIVGSNNEISKCYCVWEVRAFRRVHFGRT